MCKVFPGRQPYEDSDPDFTSTQTLYLYIDKWLRIQIADMSALLSGIAAPIAEPAPIPMIAHVAQSTR